MFVCMIICLDVFLSTMYKPGVQGGQKGALDPQELAL